MIQQTARIAAFAAALAAASPLAAQEREAARKPQTDRTVAITRGSRLVLNNDVGEVVVRTWDRDSMRLQAMHGARTTIDVETNANIVNIRARTAGPSRAVDYDITVPSWLPMRVTGQAAYIGIEGAQNEVIAETVRGDIVVRGGAGTVTAKSIHGEIFIENTKGRVNATSVNEAIHVSRTTGEITVETTNGDIILSKIDPKFLDVGSVNGDVQFDGTLSRGAQLKFVTHNGDITLALPENTGATFAVRTYNGEFVTDLPAKAVGEVRRGRRITYVLGNGGADVELESFGGTIRLRRPGSGPRPRGRDKDKEKEPEHESRDQSARIAATGSTLAARSAGDAAATIAVSTSTPAIVVKLHGSHGAI
jgi:DUF4097 and DUF4098 domain-containing protein YvlB